MILLLACAVPGPVEGTAIGNPSGAVPKVADGVDLRWTSASAPLAEVRLVACDDGEERVQVGAQVDLLGAASLDLPAGDWCSLTLAFDGPLELHTLGPKDAYVTLSLTVPEIVLTASRGLSLDGDLLLLELGAPAWVSAAEIGADGTAAVEISSGPLHDELVARLRARSAAYRDHDDDGDVDDEDREHGEDAHGDDDEDDEDGAGEDTGGDTGDDTGDDTGSESGDEG